MAARLIKVRYAGRCANCSATVAARMPGWWDSTTKLLRCETCGPVPSQTVDERVDGEPLAVPASAPTDPAPPTSDRARASSLAGASAQRVHDRRHDRREAGIRARHPRIGGLILALSEDPQSTRAWARGAEGERRVGARLDGLTRAGVVALHDRRIPGTKANIDHIAIAPSGISVIDSKRYTGQVAKKDLGGFFRTDLRLMVGRRDCTKLVTAMPRQVAAVRSTLTNWWSSVAIKPVLCFVDADWGWFPKPFELQGVLVTGPRALAERLSRSGPLSPAEIDRIADELDSKLRPA